jgi:hypothetical protein
MREQRASGTVEVVEVVVVAQEHRVDPPDLLRYRRDRTWDR